MVELSEKELMVIDGGRGQHELNLSINIGFRGFGFHAGYSLSFNEA